MWAVRSGRARTRGPGRSRRESSTRGRSGARDAAAREFREELGVDPPDVPYVELGTFGVLFGLEEGHGVLRRRHGIPPLRRRPRRARVRRVRDGVAAAVGTPSELSEIDRVAWMPLAEAGPRLVAGQRPALDALEVLLRQE
ncbi:NUDIX domain-containing protein [Microbacterium aurum]